MIKVEKALDALYGLSELILYEEQQKDFDLVKEYLLQQFKIKEGFKIKSQDKDYDIK